MSIKMSANEEFRAMVALGGEVRPARPGDEDVLGHAQVRRTDLLARDLGVEGPAPPEYRLCGRQSIFAASTSAPKQQSQRCSSA